MSGGLFLAILRAASDGSSGGSSVLIAVLQVAAGGSLVQILIRLGAFFYKRLSKPEQRKAAVSADSTNVETAADVVLMVRGELKEVREQHAKDRLAWDTERVRTTQSLEDAAREVARVHAELARVKSDLAVARAQIAELSGRAPGRHSNFSPGDYDWGQGP